MSLECKILTLRLRKTKQNVRIKPSIIFSQTHFHASVYNKQGVERVWILVCFSVFFLYVSKVLQSNSYLIQKDMHIYTLYIHHINKLWLWKALFQFLTIFFSIWLNCFFFGYHLSINFILRTNCVAKQTSKFPLWNCLNIGLSDRLLQQHS